MTQIALNYVSNISLRPGHLLTEKLSKLRGNMNTILLLSPCFELDEKRVFSSSDNFAGTFCGFGARIPTAKHVIRYGIRGWQML